MLNAKTRLAVDVFSRMGSMAGSAEVSHTLHPKRTLGTLGETYAFSGTKVDH